MGIIEKLRMRGLLPKAAVYARFSSDNQREESIDAQLRAIREYAKNNGIIIVAEYVDKARSATTDDRPQFLQMVEDSKQDRFNLLLVHKLDRFARNRQDSIGYRMELKRNGVSLISVLEYLDEDSPESVILESVLEAMAEYYSKNLAREVKKGMKENALQCISTGGRPPFGYRLNPDTRRYEVDEDEAPAVRLIFDGVCAGKGYNLIIRELNAQGYKTRNGQQFGKNSLHEIVRNEKYKGVYLFNRASTKGCDGSRNNHLNKYPDEMIRVEGGMPAIVDEETFDTVTKIVAARKKLSPSNAAKETYLLSGKIFCGDCGNTFVGNRKFSGRNKNILVTYRCNTRSRKTSDACADKELRREYIESFVKKQLANIIFNEDNIPSLVAKFREYNMQSNEAANEKCKRIEKKLSEIDGKLANIVSAIAATGSTALISALDAMERDKAMLQSELEETRATLDAVQVTEEQVRRAYSQARDLYLSGGLDEMRQLINLYLDKVVVYREHVEVFLHVLPIFLCPNGKATPPSRDGKVANDGGGEGS